MKNEGTACVEREEEEVATWRMKVKTGALYFLYFGLACVRSQQRVWQLPVLVGIPLENEERLQGGC